MKPLRMLVTGAGGSPGHNFIASLRMVKERKIYIVGADISKEHLELNNLVDKKYLLPRTSSPEYLKKLNKIIKAEKIDFVHCQPEEEVWFMSHNKNKVQTRTFFPPPATLKITYDKERLHNLLRKKGFRVPNAFQIRDRETLKQALTTLLKTGDRVWLRARRGAGSRASLPVTSMLQAEGWIDYWIKRRGLKYSDFMMSEFLPGHEFAFQSLWYQGRLITSMARERIEYLFGNLFPSGQSSSPSIARTVHREDVNELATKAVLAVDAKASGIFCVDIKENRDGQPCVMEINAGRFFTTSNNFSAAGLNMPYYYVLLGLGRTREIPKLPQYNGIPAGWYWIRLMDMGYKLVKGEKWTSINP